MSAYLGVFLEEVEEQIQLLSEQLLVLEQDGGNMDTIQIIFRAAHTLKGSSATMGFDTMKLLTHRMENIFDSLRNHQLTVSPSLINLMLECIDYLGVLKEAIMNGTLDQTNVEPLVQRLDEFKNQADAQPNNQAQQSESITEWKEEQKLSIEVEAASFVQFDEYQRQIILTAIDSGFQVLIVYVQLMDNALMKTARAFLIHNSLKEAGEILASYPPIETIEDESQFSGNLAFVIATQQTKQSLIHLINSISEIKTVHLSEVTEKSLVEYEQGKKIQVVEAPPREENKENTSSQHVDGKVKVNQTVRVDVERLEHLMNLVGELVIDQTRLVDLKNRLDDQFKGHENVSVLGEVVNHFGRVISELQEGMMKTRMLPIEQLFNRFPRMVRDISQKSGKEVEFIMEGKETELDRNLIEEVGDPIIHLIRNSLDHGIESPEERRELGKPEKGQLLLKATHEENHIVITIADDGRGIDAQKVKKSAIKKGFITEEEANGLTEKELVFLIFKSGISTANQVTEISGRGVGMDIVRSHIEKLNGLIDIDTVVGQGTVITLKVPLTLAIIRSLMVRLGEKTFAIPLVNVTEIVRLSISEVKTIKQQEVGVIRGRVLPLIRMGRKLNLSSIEETNENKRLFVVVVGIADKRVGLVVDQLSGNQEVVIKSLGKYIGTPPFISGATIMGDGDVALILDVSAIIREEGTKVLSQTAAETQVSNEDQTSIQVVAFQLGSEEYGLDIQIVKDIITVPNISPVMTAPSSVLGLINLRGKLIPVVDLCKKLNLHESRRTKKSRIMVIEVQNKQVGILVDQVTEVVKLDHKYLEAAPDHDVHSIESRFIRGIFNVPDRLVIYLDIYLVLDQQEWSMAMTV